MSGGNTRIGLWTVHHLALHGAIVYMTSRSEEKGISAISSIESATVNTNKDANAQIHLLVMDLMFLASVVAAATRIRAECN